MGPLSGAAGARAAQALRPTKGKPVPAKATAQAARGSDGKASQVQISNEAKMASSREGAEGKKQVGGAGKNAKNELVDFYANKLLKATKKLEGSQKAQADAAARGATPRRGLMA